MAGNKKTVKKINSNKTKTNTPLTIRHSKADDVDLKLPPKLALEQFRKHEAVLNDWTTINFRIQVGKILSIHFEETIINKDIDYALKKLQVIKNNFIKLNKLEMDLATVDYFGNILNVIDEMQDKTTRKMIYEAFKTVLENTKKENRLVT